jgi:F-type H+-transporting ATPase subunit b
MRQVAPIVLAALALLAVRVAAAASGGGHLNDQIINHLLIPQVVNFTIVLLGLSYILRAPFKKHFTNKAAVFAEQKEQAEKARKEAEAQNAEIKNKIKQVEETAEQSLIIAKKEADELKNKILAEAKTQANRIEEETGRMSKFEHERAIAMLRSELITNSIRFAESKMGENSAIDTQNKLNNDFIAKVGAVNL